MTGVCCGLTVSESGEGIPWILLLLLSHIGVSTIGTGGMFWILSSMMLYTGVSAVRTNDDAELNTALTSQFVGLLTLHLLNKKQTC